MFAVVLAVAACGPSSSPALPTKTITLPRAGHGIVTWTTGDLLVVSRHHDPAASRTETELWRLNSDGSNYRPLDIKRDPTCVLWNQLAPVALSDGRVAYWNWCGRGVAPPNDDDYLAAVAIDTGAVSRLAPLDVNPTQIAWLVDANRGWISFTSNFCAGITAVDSTGIREYPMVVGNGAKAFRVDSFFSAPKGLDCSGTGLADLAAPSGDGSLIAFFAVPDSVGMSDSERLNAPYRLYVADSAATKASPVLDGVVLRGSLAWSPNGRWLVFVGTFRGTPGVWIVSPDGSRATNVAGADAFSPAWSPDGTRLVVNRSISSLKEAPNDELAVIDVSSVVGQ